VERGGGAVSRAALSAPADGRLVSFNSSIDVDRRLFREDLAGSIAHVEALAAAGIVPAEDARAIVAGLRTVGEELEAGRLPFRDELEDIHTHVERRLEELVGPEVAGRLHTARSRNDQVALDEVLWLRRATADVDRALGELQRALVDQAERHAADPMPGYTHLQRAQPITLGHHLLAHVEALERDRGRFADCARRHALSPLGSGALAATTLPIDREQVARALGLSGVTRNSIDAVSARDGLLEFLAGAAIAGVHLSRLAEELCLWATSEFGFVELSDAFCTGSSLMPQKRNPDVAELVRGKAGRLVGDLVTLLAVVKGLPLAYDKDLQEDKRPALDAWETLVAAAGALAGLVGTARFLPERLRAALEDGEPCATDAAEHLVAAGVPFRRAHELVGTMVREARERGLRLADLPAEVLSAYHPALAAAEGLFDPERSLARRDVIGGPAPVRVREEVRRWRERLG
jgi:argininosuccinate lyase